MKNSAYWMGHSDFELRRLARQAQVLEPTTREYFVAAGMAPGMRVLDVGSGTGAVAFLSADLVGPSGEVVGTDLAPTAIAAARKAAVARAQGQVSFREGTRPKWLLSSHLMLLSVVICYGLKPIRAKCCAGWPSTCDQVE